MPASSRRLAGVIDGARADGTPVFTFADHVTLRTLDGDEHDHGGGDAGHDHEGGDDPHLWTDPTMIAGAVGALATELAGVEGIDAAAVEQSAAAYAASARRPRRRDQLDCSRRSPTTGASSSRTTRRSGTSPHRYDLEVVGAVIPSLTTSAGASAGELEALAEVIRDEGVPAIFGETTQPTKLAAALADEVGGDVAGRRAVHREPRRADGSGADTYVGMLRTDAERIAEALRVIDFVLDAFSSDLTQRALLGGLLAATTTALIGTWVVVRGLAFFGDALAHGVLPGIALAAIWGFDLTLGADRQRGRDGRWHQPRPPHDAPAGGHRHRPAVRRDARRRCRHHQPRADVRR